MSRDGILQVSLDEKTEQRVRELATKETRSLSNMIAKLVLEALAARGKR